MPSLVDIIWRLALFLWKTGTGSGSGGESEGDGAGSSGGRRSCGQIIWHERVINKLKMRDFTS